MLFSAALLITLSMSVHAIVIPDHVKQALARLNESISDESCSFYKDVEKFIPCGKDGYTVHFAHHYCQVYLQHRNEFINRSWIDATRRCLQVKLYEFVNQQQSYPSCERVKQFGFDSHPICYEKPDPSRPALSFCRVPLADKIKVAWLAANGALMEVLRGAAAIKFCLWAPVPMLMFLLKWWLGKRKRLHYTWRVAVSGFSCRSCSAESKASCVLMSIRSTPVFSLNFIRLKVWQTLPEKREPMIFFDRGTELLTSTLAQVQDHATFLQIIDDLRIPHERDASFVLTDLNEYFHPHRIDIIAWR